MQSFPRSKCLGRAWASRSARRAVAAAWRMREMRSRDWRSSAAVMSVSSSLASESATARAAMRRRATSTIAPMLRSRTLQQRQSRLARSHCVLLVAASCLSRLHIIQTAARSGGMESRAQSGMPTRKGPQRRRRTCCQRRRECRLCSPAALARAPGARAACRHAAQTAVPLACRSHVILRFRYCRLLHPRCCQSAARGDREARWACWLRHVHALPTASSPHRRLDTQCLEGL